MAVDKARFKISKLVSDNVRFEDVEVSIGEIEEEWDEKAGPTPKPSTTDLRSWDYKLLKRHEPLYSPLCDVCCLCTFGTCDLTKGKKGACGINIRSQQARMNVLVACMGTAAHASHAMDTLEHAIKKVGEDAPINYGQNVECEAPIIRTVIGKKPKTLRDLKEAMEYANEQITITLASTATGQEGSYLDLESKGMHASMMDNVVKEVADIANIIGYDFPKGDPDAPLVELGPGTIDKDKPTILCVGHNVVPGAGIIDYAEKEGVMEDLGICGICCTAHDIARKDKRVKVVGPYTQQMKFVKSGLADVIVADVQCVRTDMLEQAQKVSTPLITTNQEVVFGLRDRTNDSADEIVSDLVSGKEPGALILNPEKVGEVAVRVAQQVAPKRKHLKELPDESKVIEEAKRCTSCMACNRTCPASIEVMEGVNTAKSGELSVLAANQELCLGCLKCESACPKGIPIVTLMQKANEKKIKQEKYKMRSGRGPVLDTEIRNVGAPIVLGEIPGVIAFAGCTNYVNGAREVAEMAEEFLKRNYIVVVSGCAAMDIASYRNEDGKTLYEQYPGDFDAGCLVNVGSCVSNSHILGAAIKIPYIFARRNLRANFEEIADYIYTRVGAVAVDWGAMTQKAFAIGTGVNRWGIPVITGPQGAKYRRMYLGRSDRERKLYDAKTGDEIAVEAAPEHLAYVVESKEEAIPWIAKLCIRPNDTSKGRMIKLAHYTDLHKKYLGTMPPDLHLLVRTPADIHVTMRDEIVKMIKEKGWKERKIVQDPTIVERLVRAAK